MQEKHEGVLSGEGTQSTTTLGTSSTSKLSPPTDARMHSRVRSALSDVKSMHTAEAPVSDGLLSESSSWQSSQQGQQNDRRRRSSVQHKQPSKLKDGSLTALSPKPSVLTSASTTDLFMGSTLSNTTPHALRKHGGKVERKSHNGGDLGKEILAHQAGKKAPSHFLSVVPPLPDLQRLGPEAQKSLENLTLALSMS